MERSGCQITWDYFHKSTRPWFVNYVGDRDLWQWKLPNSKEINHIFFENNMLDPLQLDNITNLLKYNSTQIDDLIKEGSSLLLFQKKQIDLAVSRAVEASMTINDFTYNIWLGSMYGDRSEYGNILAHKPLSNGKIPDFSASWIFNVKTREWQISLRGNKTSPDLSKIAEFYDGGGHCKSSGFIIKYPKTLHDIFLIK
jgi:oligoribonuclease NrnB/cAMP/cGMP phosphodiesterase (DHH superfamily)